MSKPKYYITTAIAYTSGKPHIGNTYEAFWQTPLRVIKDSRATTYFFQTGTVRDGQKLS